MSKSRRVSLQQTAVTLAELHEFYGKLSLDNVSDWELYPARQPMYEAARTALEHLGNLIEQHDVLIRTHRKLVS